MTDPISIIKLAKWLRGIIADVRECQIFLILDIKNGKLFVRKAEFHG